MVNGRVKGAKGEREAGALIMSWLEPVYRHAGVKVPELKRNLEQVRSGGYDLVGIKWLALEVKRHENLTPLSQWWKQTLNQAGRGQIPVLMYRQNNQRWKFRVRIKIAHGRIAPYSILRHTVDMDQDTGQLWLQTETYSRLVSAIAKRESVSTMTPVGNG